MKDSTFNKAMEALAGIVNSPYNQKKIDEITKWMEYYDVPFIGGGHNRVVGSIEANGEKYALKIPVRMGGIEDNAIELYNSQYAKALYNKFNISVGSNISYSDDAQIDSMIDRNNRPIVLVQEFIEPLHNEAETSTKVGEASMKFLLEFYDVYKTLIDELNEYFYLADVDLRKPFNYGIRKEGKDESLVLLDHGLVVPRFNVNGKRLEPIPIQCPNCGNINTLQYYVPPNVEEICKGNNYTEAKVEAIKKTPTEEKHKCDNCNAYVDSVILIKEVLKNL